MSGMASGVLGIARGLVELVSGTDGAMVKFITIGQGRYAMNMPMKVGGTFQADMTEPLMPQNLEVVPRERSEVGIDGGDLSTSLLEVQAVGLKRGGRAMMDQAGGWQKGS